MCTTCAYGGAHTCVDPCWEGGLAHVGASICEFEALGVEVGKLNLVYQPHDLVVIGNYDIVNCWVGAQTKQANLCVYFIEMAKVACYGISFILSKNYHFSC